MKEWKTWFKHDDGTPKTRYLELNGKSELILTYIQLLDEWSMTIRLVLAAVDVQREIRFTREDMEQHGIQDETWDEMEKLAEQTAKDYLSELSHTVSNSLSVLQ